MLKRLPILLAALALPAATVAKAPAKTVTAGMVSAADPRAAAAGVEILQAGGSAADAAIAMMLALNVVEPQSSGIGGGGFLMSHDARSGRVQGYDGREEAPRAADGQWFYGADGKPMSHSEAVPGGRSVGVPGNLRMMALVHKQHGVLPWARLFQPAIRLARGGFDITPRLANLIKSGRHADSWAKAYLFDAEGNPKAAGTHLTDPDQAALLEKIAARGPDYFYSGVAAQALVATVNGAARNPSKMAVTDLAAYRAHERPPVCGMYRGYRICGMGPPSSGGIAVFQILKQLERFDMAALGKDSPTAWHLFAESERLAYADRDLYLGDPGFVSVPVEGLIDPAYLAKRSALISETATMASAAPGLPAGAPARVRAPVSEVPSTTNMTVADAAGNFADVTSTIEGIFGSGLTVSGVFLNNELTDFDIVPVAADGTLVANRVQGGKRPRSSMSPTIVYGPDGKVRLAIGAAGGSTIIAQVAKALVGVIDWKLPVNEAIALPLLYAPGPTGIIEKGTAMEAMVPALQALGEKVSIAALGLKANAIEMVGGRLAGGADPRSEGVAMAVDGTITRPVGKTSQPGEHSYNPAP